MITKAEQFDQLARNIIAPVYPVIAGEFLEKSKISSGLCLDLGCGSGYLGLAIARMSDLKVSLVDSDPEMLAIAQRNINDSQLQNRASILLADVHQIPLASGSAQLAVSRGSVFFWGDLPQAFSEIYRVLSPGGMAFIGGGFGTPELKKKIDMEMRQRHPNWSEHLRENIGAAAPEKYRTVMAEAGIADYYIDHSPIGMWIVFEKKSAGATIR